MTVSKKTLVSWANSCLPRAAGGLNIMNLCTWNKATILIFLWDIDRKEIIYGCNGFIATTTKMETFNPVRIPKNASWVVRKVLEAREQLKIRIHIHGKISQQLQGIQLGGKFSIHKMYNSLLPDHPKVAWKFRTMHQTIHPRHRLSYG